ncbi:MAG: RloB family protein [Cyanobacteriota bacterium]
MDRKKRPLNRLTNVRDSKLYVIATEGSKTEKVYLDALSKHYRNSKIHIKILERLDPHNSSPNHVIEELNKFKKEYKLDSHDELWMLIDLDRWHRLFDIAQKCVQKNFNLAVSNPCFEIWLLLHISDLTNYNKNDLEKSKGYCEKELRNLLGSYNKSNPDLNHFLPNIKDAINRAKQLDVNLQDRWPISFGSRVYKLVEKII